MAQDIPVYLFTGFMDSGKTSLVEETLFENEFGDGAKGVIIMCEDGEKEYDEAKLATINFKLTSIESEEEFTPQKLQEIQDTFQPEQVFIEYNGTWGMDKILEAQMPEGWVIVQSLATVDSTTFDMYMNNMRAMMQEQVFSSDVVIFNRTDDDTDRGHLRRSIKAINRKAQIVYERKDGTIDERPEELPFDINQDPEKVNGIKRKVTCFRLSARQKQWRQQLQCWSSVSMSVQQWLMQWNRCQYLVRLLKS